VPEALYELVDNSFDEDSGNASEVHITWDRKTRVMSVLDNGAGMDDIADLFTLGKGKEHGERGISMYGVGGSEALLYLGDKIVLCTLRGGLTSFDLVDWGKCIRTVEFPDVDNKWRKATSVNVVPELLAHGHGTMISFKVLGEHRIVDGEQRAPIQREIARTYAAGLRAGKVITWNGDHLRPWEPGVVTDVHEFDVVVRDTMKAHVVVGRCEGVDVSYYRMTVNFGYRRVEDTKEAFGKYSGVGAVGRIDLGMEWKPYLTTTKNGFKDDELRAELYAAVYAGMKDFLEELSAERRQTLIANLALNLEKKLGGLFRVEVKGRGPDKQPRKKPEQKEAEEEEPEPQPPRKGVTVIHLQAVNEAELPGRLVEADVAEGRPIVAKINVDQEVVKTALDQRPINQMLLIYMIVSEMAKELSGQQPLLVKMHLYKQSELEDLKIERSINGSDKALIPYITRKLFHKVGMEVEE